MRVLRALDSALRLQYTSDISGLHDIFEEKGWTRPARSNNLWFSPDRTHAAMYGEEEPGMNWNLYPLNGEEHQPTRHATLDDLFEEYNKRAN